MLNADRSARRAIPSVDRLLQLPAVQDLIAAHGRTLVVDTVRAGLTAWRGENPAPDAAFDTDHFTAQCAAALARAARPSLRPVFNLTGTVLHTNLGRAVLPQVAADAALAAMTSPVNLEFDLGEGRRGDRDVHVERLLAELTGAEAATVVNNNAAAVYLALNSLGARREVIVSRGELIEIGGAFRMPDIMARAGVKMVEVGTTNRTHRSDFAGAIGLRTAALMKVHTSNYAVQGFTAAVPERELAALAHEHGVAFIVDLGSGMLVDLARWGLPHEPTPRESLADGADVVTFSGDKLLGGPQAGLIVGAAEHIRRIKKNPMKRALRVDKMTLAALEAVLRLYRDPDRLTEHLPTLRWLTRPTADIEAQATRLLPALAAACGPGLTVQSIACMSQIGSGSLPVDLLPSRGLAIAPPGRRRGGTAEKIADAFRALPVPVVGRIAEGAFILDLRCLDREDEFVAQLSQLKLAI